MKLGYVLPNNWGLADVDDVVDLAVEARSQPRTPCPSGSAGAVGRPAAEPPATAPVGIR
ncbi:MAG: hypothetical protein GY745_14490 [Actinomycetia bacterium]|nr:hypothetical protein [Actinomycetes bacterium]